MVPADFYEVISALTRCDPTCTQLISELAALEPHYTSVLESLCDKDRQIIDRYISVCEELEYQKARLVARHYALTGANGFVL